MLALYCSSNHTDGLVLKSRSLKDCILKDCAELCIENAQQIITLVKSLFVPGDAFGITIWWNRIFYLHLSGTVLIAAMLRADLFTPSVKHSWDTAMLLLRAHSHLSHSIQQCVTTFQILSSKITEAQSPVGGQAAPSDKHPSIYFNDVFHDIGLDIDNSLFGMEDMAWLSHFEH